MEKENIKFTLELEMFSKFQKGDFFRFENVKEEDVLQTVSSVFPVIKDLMKITLKKMNKQTLNESKNYLLADGGQPAKVCFLTVKKMIM
jgi:hypothetical protein